MKNYYITTPIYYPSAKFHLGHTYTTVAGDVMKKYKQQDGYNVFYMTGTDEHGEKIEKKASENNLHPLEYIEPIIEETKKLWSTLNIDYDYFIRTTEAEHKKQVQYIFDRLKKQGDIYLDKYVGWYCRSCESFFTELQLVDGACPDCGQKVELLEEESYFFDCQKYQKQLEAYYENHPDFILPVSRKNELLNNFIKPGVQNLAVSRTSFDWGIPVVDDENHVIYVWIDALSNYITGLGYMDNSELYKQYWPADVHLVGKEITRFHAIYWPMILMALGEPLPKQIFAHGWLLMNGDKMSKSKGNIIYPEYIVENYGVDSLRYYLMREISFGEDGQFTPTSFINRLNSDIVNDLSNLVNRTITMVNKYCSGTVKRLDLDYENKGYLENLFTDVFAQYQSLMENFYFSKALEVVWSLVSATNKYIDMQEPWLLGRDPEQQSKLEMVLYELLASINKIAVLIYPFMPETSQKIKTQLNLELDYSFANLKAQRDSFHVVEKAEIIMQRLDAQVEIAKLNQNMQDNYEKAQAALQVAEPQITIEHFNEMKLVVGQIIKSRKHENADKLLVSTVELGDRQIQVVSGIAHVYDPEKLVGKKVIIVANLQATKLRGELSQGMLLCSGTGADIRLIELAADVKVGEVVK